MPSFVSHLEAAIDGTILDHRRPQTVHDGRPVWVRYDLDAVRSAVTRQEVSSRAPDLWRYRELLPVEGDDNVVSLGEGMSPTLRCDRLGAELGLRNLFIKDESQLPTGSFKSRGLAVAVSRAKELGIRRLAIPTAGNAGGSLAAYAARAGLEAWVFMPTDTPLVNQMEAAHLGARVFTVDGTIADCGAVVRSGQKAMGWFDMSTLKEPYRLEGKKTMGLELAEQFGWRLPDAIFYPTGGGTGLLGMWKAFAELAALGWLDGNERPRMYACQAVGCAPLVHAWESGDRFAAPVEAPTTSASGLRVPAAVGDFMISDVLRESKGAALAAEEDRLLAWAHVASSLEGISVCPEAGAALASLERAIADGKVRSDEQVVVFNTGAAQKYVEVISTEIPHLAAPVDWARFSG